MPSRGITYSAFSRSWCINGPCKAYSLSICNDLLFTGVYSQKQRCMGCVCPGDGTPEPNLTARTQHFMPFWLSALPKDKRRAIEKGN